MKTHCNNTSAGYAWLFPQESILTPECRSLFSQLRRYWERYNTRRQLAKLTPRQLQDAGLTPEQVSAEVKKPFWR